MYNSQRRKLCLCPDGEIYTHQKRNQNTQSQNNHHTQTAPSSPMSSSKPTRGKEAKKGGPPPRHQGRSCELEENARCCPQHRSLASWGWGKVGWERSGPWDLAAPWSAGEKRLKLEPAGERAPASHPGLFPPNPVSLPPRLLPLTPGSPMPRAAGTSPCLYFRSPQIKDTKIEGKRGKLLAGVKEAAERGCVGG